MMSMHLPEVIEDLKQPFCPGHPGILGACVGNRYDGSGQLSCARLEKCKETIELLEWLKNFKKQQEAVAPIPSGVMLRGKAVDEEW